MAVIKGFEDIEAWRKARELTRLIYQITSSGEFAHDSGLSCQIRRAAVSIMSNIAEGFARGGDKEFRQFLALAKGSSGEVRAQLYVALDQGYVTNEKFEELLQKTREVSSMISGFMKYLKQSEWRGNKYK
ncbi:MAG: four helix bundle protein [Deltaproteobacteria bacterium]|nr:four helix bundle protein [Deltaproteobacteria bacterium]